MTQARAAVFKIPTESPQPARGAVSRARRGAAKPKAAGLAAGRVAGAGTRAAIRGDGGVIELGLGIAVYPPRDKGGRWRAVWHEDGKRQQCESVSEEKLAAKLEKVRQRLAMGASNMTRPGADLIAWYLSPDRLPVAERWSRKHADTQRRLCERFAAPVIGAVTCQDITTVHMQKIVNAAPTASEGDRVHRMLSALVGAGLKGGYLVSPVLAEVHWQAGGRPVPAPAAGVAGESSLWVDPSEVPSGDDVTVLGKALSARRHGERDELMANLAAYSGLRWGELAALTAGQVAPAARVITVDRKVVEVGGRLYAEAPKNRKHRRTVYPRRAPAGYPLAERLAARVEEARAEQEAGANPLGLIFPSRSGGHWRSSNFNRRILQPAYRKAGWRDSAGQGRWTWHSLRHVFCTTALFTWKLDPTDVSRMAGHANYRITLDMYVGVTAGVLDRARAATELPSRPLARGRGARAAGCPALPCSRGGGSMPALELRQPGPGPLRVPAGTAGLPRLPAVSGVDRAIRVSTAAVVVAVAGIAAYISYQHAYAVVRQYGESGLTAELEPATIDGLVYASSMVILYAARHRLPVPGLARWMLALGIAASLAVNVAQGWSHGLAGAMVAAWPAVSLVGSYELAAWIIRTAASSGPGHVPGADHGVPQPGQPGTIPRPAVSPAREAVPDAAPGDGASPGPESAHDRLPVAGAVALARGPGPGGPGGTGHADQGNHAGGPVRESTGPRGPGGPAAPGPATATAPDGDTDAAAVAAYRASLREGRPLSERKLAQAFGKTSRRWARNRMAEARQEPVAC